MTPPSSDPPSSPYVDEALRLVQADQKATVELIARFITLQTATRSVVVPIAGAFAGLALTNHAPALAYVAIPILLIAISIESRLGALQQEAHRRAVYLEGLVQSNLSELSNRGTPVSGDAAKKLIRKLNGYQFGTSRSFRVVPFKTMVHVAARRAVTWMYVALMVLVVIAGLTASALTPIPTDTCIRVGSGPVIRVSGEGVTMSGNFTVIPCPQR